MRASRPTAVVASLAASALTLATFVTSANARLSVCPAECKGTERGSWATFSSVKRLSACDEHMLIDFALYNPLHDPATTVKIRACTVPSGKDEDEDDSSLDLPLRPRRSHERDSQHFSPFSKRAAADAGTSLCVDTASAASSTLGVSMAGDGSNMTWVTADALALVSSYMSASCDLRQTFSYGEGAIVGVYSGAAIDNGGSVGAILAEAIAIANNSETGSPESFFVQRCASDEAGNSTGASAASTSAKNIFGVAVNNAGDLSWVQTAVRSWSDGVCLNASSFTAATGVSSSTVANITVWEYSHPAVVLSNLTDPGSTRSSTGSASATSATAVASSGLSSLQSTSAGLTPSTTRAPTTQGSSATAAPSTSLKASAVSATTASTGSYSTPPGPTQTGIASNCNGYSIPAAGQGCYDFAAVHGITLDEFYAWNPAVGECANFWAGEAYCISVSASAKSRSAEQQLDRRSDCTTVTVASGDSCGSLASECGISAADFSKYNNATGLCASLVPGQRVCCSAGTLPDIRPKENANGTCFAYTIQSGDSCSVLAAKYDLTNTEIEEFNNGTTWGWFGCQNVLADLNICLSTGDPPLPNPVDGAECGPTVPGTVASTNGTALSDLNPCPLNACCDIWGQCGITPEYCTNTTGPAGNPGTAPAGENGCISNCGTEITNADRAPDAFISVGYYESWNWDRPCLNFRAASVDTSQYTHVHWAFATIDDDFKVVINDSYSQWADFKALPAKRIVSLGGWGYSTSADTYNQLRVAMSPDNAVTFADNIITFLNDEGLDGVDFDWEYPGAPDIPGIPAGLASDGDNYFKFLGALRGRLGLDTDKTISFAAPASYWYLQHFPVKSMAGEADYVVFMTYDLHGQWDYGNTWSQEGCDNGNCLRSHVNLTETMYTLAMITKAGVPASQVVVGVSSYGRSFGMADADCTGPECTFTGSATESTASPGQCTVTGGYISNAEILDFVNANVSVNSWYDADTDSNYLVYNETSWVAYMTDDVKASRRNRYKDLNFAGTVDWAVDLAHWSGSDGSPDGSDNSCTGTDDNGDCDEGDPLTPWTPCDADLSGQSLDDLSDDTIAGWPTHCAAQYMLEALANLLAGARQSFADLLADGYDHKFKVYSKAVAASAKTQVHDFLQAHGNDYFTCSVTEFQLCCSQCESNSRGGSYCDYCLPGSCYEKHGKRGDYVPGNNRKLVTSWINETEPCPPDYSKRGYGPDDPYEQTIYWTLQDDRADAFFADILNATGIPKDKIGFGLYTDIDSCSGSGNSPGNGDDCWNTGYEFGAPFPNGYGAADVANPEALAQSGLDNSADLPGQIADLLDSMKALSYLGDGFAAVDAVSLPILMIAQGVDSMSVVAQTADKIEEEERKALILAFISAILFFVPIAGELVGAVAEIGDIVAIIDVLGAAGNAAMDVYTVVDDPANAPLAIVDLIMAPLALADVAIVARAAELRRGMSAEDLAKLGTRVGQRMSKVTKGTGKCTA